MSLIINLPKRCIEIENSGVKFLFTSDDSFFFLRVIALVAQKMKDRAQVQNDSEYISIGDFENEAWSFAEEKPRNFKSIESMRINIYQAWRNRLKPMHDKCLYETKRPEDKIHTKHSSGNINNYFETEAGKGPARAAYKIGIHPSEIEIVSDVALSILINESKDKTPITTLDDKEKAQRFFQILGQITDPRSYINVMAESNKAIVSLLNQHEICKPNEKGKLPLTLGEYAEIYSKHLGMRGFSGSVVIDIWFRELKSEPWWVELINTVSPEERAVTSRLHLEPDPKEMAEYCLLFGDIFCLMWLFHRGYIAHIVASKRDHFISDLQNQKKNVKEHVYREWAKLIGDKVDSFDVAGDPHKAFNFIQYKKGNFFVLRYVV